MNQKELCLYALVALTVSCSQESGNTENLRHAYATVEPITEPRIFARGVVSSENPEFGTSFSHDGRTVYFNWASADRSVLKILQSTFANGKWGPPLPLPFSDGAYRDVDPFVAPDGERLYFSSNRPLFDDEPKGDFDTWYVEKAAGGWSEPINPGAPLNGPGHEVFVSAANNGTVYFRLDGANDGARAIYKATVSDGVFQEPVAIDLGIQDPSNPCIAADESFLIVSARNPAGDDSDLFASRFVNGAWQAAEPLASPVNSEYTEFAPALSPDGRYLFFTSERPGVVPAEGVIGRRPGDIYQIDLNQIWGIR